MESKGMKVNVNNTKVMIGEESHKGQGLQNTRRWPCGVCGRGVGRNSIRCTNCQKWVHKKCSAIP